jgi:hypothetical protein
LPHRIGNHIVVATEDWVFDFHGYSRRTAFLDHACKLPRDVLISERRSRAFDRLWLREAGQFLHDALPRARRYLDRFPAPDTARRRGL